MNASPKEQRKWNKTDNVLNSKKKDAVSELSRAQHPTSRLPHLNSNLLSFVLQEKECVLTI